MLAACASGSGGADASAGFSSDRISVTTQGSGQDVIFIPGLSSSREIWDASVAALGPNYRVHLVQVNGFAGAPAGANGEGVVAAPVAEEIARYIREQGLDHPAVIGHSLGGTMGMMLTARHPELVGKLMVVDMFPFMGAMFGGPAATPESLAPVADQIRAAMLASPQGVVSPQTIQTINSMVRTESERARIIEHSRLSNVPTVANAYHELIVTDLRPELRNITQPMTVLFVIPPQAPITAEQYEGFMRASYVDTPQARIVRIDESYHFIMIDQLDRFVSEVRTFLAE
ncbi:MAG: alpha/beta hydrolase [Caulobacterales bacterium]|nr:alpha/beta hydrolase [Caulobacterales bacterium]